MLEVAFIQQKSKVSPAISLTSTCYVFRIMHLQETGLVDTLRTRYFIKDDTCVASVSLTKPATVEDIQGPLIVLGMLLVICLAGLVIEICLHRHKQRSLVTPTPQLIPDSATHRTQKAGYLSSQAATPVPRARGNHGLVKVNSKDSMGSDNPPRTARQVQLAFHK